MGNSRTLNNSGNPTMSIRSKAHALAERLKHKLSLCSHRGHVSRMARHHGAICEPLESRMLLSTVTVTGTADLIDGDTSSIAALIATPGNDGEITLREAVQAANNTVGEDVIEFDQALAGETITLSSALNVLDSLSIVGLGEDQLTLAMENQFAFFTVYSTNLSLDGFSMHGDVDYAIFAEPGNLVLGNLTFENGNAVTAIQGAHVVITGDLNAVNSDLAIGASDMISVYGSLTAKQYMILLGGEGAMIGNYGEIHLVQRNNGMVFLLGGGVFENVYEAYEELSQGDGGIVIPPNGADPVSVIGMDGADAGGGSTDIPGETIPVGGNNSGGGVTLEGSGSSGSGGGTTTVGGGGTTQPNAAPTANDMTLTAMEDGDTVTLAFDVTDPDSGDSLTYQLLSNQPHGQLINNGNGTFSYTAGDWLELNDGMQRDISFTYRVIDNHGAASEPATVTITIQGQTETQGGNDAAPIGVPNFTRTDSQTPIDINVLANDHSPDTDLLITSHVEATSSLGVALTVNADGTIAYDPTEALADLDPDERVRDTFRYTVSDPFGDSDTVRVFVDVTGAQTPVVNVASQSSHQRSTLAMRQPVLVHDQAEFMPWSLPSTPPMSQSLQSLLQGDSEDENANRLHLLLVDEVSIDASV